MLAQDVINAVSSDMRQVLSSSSPDSAIILPWVDRIQKDILHTSLYNYLNRFVFTISVVSGTSSYSMTGATPGVRRILSVYDRTFDRVLLPFESLGLPSVKADAKTGEPESIPKPLLSASTMNQWPEFYQRLQGTSTSVILFPAPQKTAFDGSYEIYYEGEVATVTATTATLTLPDDGLDMIVAGVNSLAAAYLKNPEDYQVYKAQYEAMKTGNFPG